MKANLSANRNLYTGDCTYLFFDPDILNPGGGRYTARVIHDHIDHLAASGIDTYLCNPQASANWWPSKRMPTGFDGYRRGDREFLRGQVACDGITGPPEAVEKHIDLLMAAMHCYLDLQEAGIDWPAECARACRRRKMSPWVTVRMNDMHGSGNPEGSYFNCPPFRDPANRLRGQWIGTWPGYPPLTWPYFAGMNYEKRPVRDFVLGTIRELVEDYDFEGMELDWLRNPICMEPTASQEQIESMLDFHSEIRRLTEEKGRRMGKHYVLGLRIPPNFGLLRSIGLDVHAMVRAGLVDFLSVSNFWQTSWDLPYDQYCREFAGEIALYGVIEAAPNWVHGYDPLTGRRGARLSPVSPEFLRGNAAGKLAMGVHGLEYFNFFARDTGSDAKGKPVGDYALLADLPHLDRLRGQRKSYTVSTMFGACWIPPFEMTEQLPAVLEPRWRRALRLSMAAEPRGSDLDLVIQLVVEKKDRYPALGVSFNDGWPTFDAEPTDELISRSGVFTHHVPEHQAFNYRFRASQIREGWNEVTVFNGSVRCGSAEERQEDSVHLVSVELGVR